MGVVRDIINGFDPVDKNEELIKETLQVLMELSEQKAKVFETQIEKDLLDGKLSDTTLTVPITRVVNKRVEHRAKTQVGVSDFIDKISDSIQTMFTGNSNILKGIAGTLNTGLNVLMGTASGEEEELRLYFVVAEYPAIVRYDFAFWNRTIKSEGIKTKMQNVLSCVAFKSAVDMNKLAFNDFLTLYGPILRKAFGENETEIKKLLLESQEIYKLFKVNQENLPEKNMLSFIKNS